MHPKALVVKTRAAWNAAIEARADAESAMRAKRRALEDEAEARIREALREEAAEVSKLRAAEDARRSEYEAAQVSATEASTDGPAIGTAMAEWSRGRHSGYYSIGPRAMKLTGRKGRIEVWRRDSPSPANMRWGLPEPGDRYVRVLKKDGTDSRAFEKLTDWKSSWLPEGETPKGAA